MTEELIVAYGIVCNIDEKWQSLNVLSNKNVLQIMFQQSTVSSDLQKYKWI